MHKTKTKSIIEFEFIDYMFHRESYSNNCCIITYISDLSNCASRLLNLCYIKLVYDSHSDYVG